MGGACLCGRRTEKPSVQWPRRFAVLFATDSGETETGMEVGKSVAAARPAVAGFASFTSGCPRFCGAAAHMGFINEATALLVGFDCMLRSGELYNRTVGNISFFQNKAVLCLGQSNAGKRSGANEMVVVESALAICWLQKACHQSHKTQKLLWRGERFFRRLFHELCSLFELTVYSLRRGGATWNFLHHGSMEKTLLRGRWASTSTARIYLQDATAIVSHLQLTAVQRSQLRSAGRFLETGRLKPEKGKLKGESSLRMKASFSVPGEGQVTGEPKVAALAMKAVHNRSASPLVKILVQKHQNKSLLAWHSKRRDSSTCISLGHFWHLEPPCTLSAKPGLLLRNLKTKST